MVGFMTRGRLTLGAALAALLLFGVAERAPAWWTGQVVRVRVGRLTVKARVAADVASRARGLGGVRRLDPGWGMLFVFRRPEGMVFWMKGMLIPIDIIFIRGGRVVKVFLKVPPPGPAGRVVTTGRPVIADTVLEVGAGSAAGVRLGDPVRITPGPAGP
jgi:uncharacterized membrane protein (UPF0127 family)